MLRYFLILPIVIILFASPVFAENGTIKTISNSSKDSINSSIAINGKNIFIVWAEQSRSGMSDLFFAKSTDGGQTFSEPKQITTKQGSSGFPSIATDGTNLYITWMFRFPDSYSGSWSDDNSEIHFSKSTDGGKTFIAPLKISADNSFSSGSEIAINGKNIFITWFNHLKSPEEIFYSKSIDGGETFSTPKKISNNEGVHNSFIVTDGTNILVTWSDGSIGNSDIFFTKSIDGGETFSTPQNISNNSENSVGSYIATNGTNIFITWFEIVKGSGDIFFTKSTDGGKTFSKPQNISSDLGNSVTPSILANDNNVFLAWTDSNPKSMAILLAKSANGGQTFDEPINISGDRGFADSQSIATDGKNIFLTWNWAEQLEGYPEIFFNKLPIEPLAYNENATNDISQDKSEQPSDSNQTDSSKSFEKVPTDTINSIKWLDEDYANYSVGGIGIIKLVYPTLNVNKAIIDIPTAYVWSETDPKGIPVDMIETGADTGIFYADISFTDMNSSYLSLQVSKGDTVTVLFQDSTIMTSEHSISSTQVEESITSPKNQIENGVFLDQVKCKEGLELIIKLSDNSPACVKPETKQKLIERGWTNK
jgi:hypothetical protein